VITAKCYKYCRSKFNSKYSLLNCKNLKCFKISCVTNLIIRLKVLLVKSSELIIKKRTKFREIMHLLIFIGAIR
jgi:hypothetical protein